LKNIRCIFFDLDNTLFPSDEAYALGLKYAWRRLIRVHPQSFRTFSDRYGAARRQVQDLIGNSPSAHNRTLYFKRLVENLRGSASPELVLGLVEAYDRCWKPFSTEEAREVCRRLSKKYRLGVITNQVCLTQMQKLRQIDPRGEWLSAVVTSEEVNAEKPDPAIFREACRRAGVRPGEAAIVGDDWAHDILGGLKAGLSPIYLGPPRPRMPSAVRRIGRLNELIPFFL
jgi:putative hydrolase of the HAD superfamily